MDYYVKGLISLDTVKSIEAEIEAWEESKNVTPPVDVEVDTETETEVKESQTETEIIEDSTNDEEFPNTEPTE